MRVRIRHVYHLCIGCVVLSCTASGPRLCMKCLFFDIIFRMGPEAIHESTANIHVQCNE
jgi:hypothetical protein